MSEEIKREIFHQPPLSTTKVILHSFLGGIFWGVGSVLGATLVVALIIWFLSQFNWIPVVGELIQQIVHQIQSQAK